MLTLNVMNFSLAVAALVSWPLAVRRVQLSLAKHPSVTGHVRMAQRLARWLPAHHYDEASFFNMDGVSAPVVQARRAGFKRLSAQLQASCPLTLEASAQLAESVSDARFIRAYRVPIPYSKYVGSQLKMGSVLRASSGVQLEDLDGNRYYDLAGSYGVNVLGYDAYKSIMGAAQASSQDLGPVLGSYHPSVIYNAKALCKISGLDEVSFHMSGTEAVMQAVRLARFHTGRTHLVRFCGAYHGWWGDVQPGPGNPQVARETYTLRDMHAATLRVLRKRRDIACVLVNPLQALHPNAAAPGDGSLIDSSRQAAFDRQAYTEWLHQLRQVCTERGIVLIFDEVFVGFRLAHGGAQAYFGVKADMVTYGKTLGGGFPVGVVCGRRDLMKRFREDRPADICFARGTFNAHPYVMAAMHIFLARIEGEAGAALYADLDNIWNRRAQQLNGLLEQAGLPVRVANMSSIWTVGYTLPSYYNWLLQFYLRAHGLALSWVGTGRLIFSLNYTDADFNAVAERFVAAASAMHQDGWWSAPATLSNKAIRRRLLADLW